MASGATRWTRALGLGLLMGAIGCGGDGTGPTVRCPSAQDPLQVGQVAILDTTGLSGCAVLTAAGDAEYLVVPFTANFEQSGSFVLSVSGARVSAEPAASATPASSAADRFHRAVRAWEARFAAAGWTPARAAGPRLEAPPTVGQVDSFWVVQNIDSLRVDTVRTSDFVRVRATLKFVGQNTLLYQDDEAPAGGFTDAELATLGQMYDGTLYPLAVNTFGSTSDVNRDGRVTILLTPYVNALTPDTATSVIVGFFFPLDLFATQTPGCAICARSNEQEIFYGIVPDPQGLFSAPRSKERVRDILPPVAIHETQHMINFNQKVFVRGLLNSEIVWLNEALSHIAEEIGGDAFAAAGDDSTAQLFYDPNFDRAFRFLEETWNHALTFVEGAGTLEERGAGWLFLRWVGDQYGDAVFGQLVQSRDRGVPNVENRTRAKFFTLFGEWAVTMYTDDLAVPNLSPRFQVRKWPLRSLLTSGGAYTLQPERLTFSQVRGAGRTRTLKASSPYYLLVDADGSGDLALEVDVSGKAGLALLRLR
jgi:hypothetical protein